MLKARFLGRFTLAVTPYGRRPLPGGAAPLGVREREREREKKNVWWDRAAQHRR